MTEVEFHTGLPDRIGFACRLLRKAVRQRARVLVTALPPTLGDLDRELWVFEEREFLPHVRVPGSAAPVRERTPVWLAPDAAAAQALPGAPRVLVNVGAAMPPDLQAVDRLIELVGDDPDEMAGGRERWRQYKAAGLRIVHHAGGEARG